VRCIRKNIPELIKESMRPGESVAEGQYELIYCAGLFDYLSDQVCASILETMYRWLAPGGLMIATNVEWSNPLRVGMSHLLDWHLVYRSGAQLKALHPRGAAPEDVRVYADETGVNVFLEVRKPEHG
jgi:extracellular factor (EF) 3-hydroxypalmitic acid methyl ester biosynthesis protein